MGTQEREQVPPQTQNIITAVRMWEEDCRHRKLYCKYIVAVEERAVKTFTILFVSQFKKMMHPKQNETIKQNA